MTLAFISFSFEDIDYSSKIVEYLSANGVNVFYDSRSALRENHLSEIEAAIERSDIIIVIISPSFVNSAYYNIELGIAIAQNRLEGTPILPIILTEVNTIPRGITRFRTIDASGDSWPAVSRAIRQHFQNAFPDKALFAGGRTAPRQMTEATQRAEDEQKERTGISLRLLMTKGAREKWEMAAKDVKATLAIAFDMAIRFPEKTGDYKEWMIKTDTETNSYFEFRIGYAIFCLMTVGDQFVLFDFDLNDTDNDSEPEQQPRLLRKMRFVSLSS